MPPPAIGSGGSPSATLYTSSNFIAGVGASDQQIRLRFADETGTSSSEFNFVKPGTGAGIIPPGGSAEYSFGPNESGFKLDPINSAGVGILSYYSGSAGNSTNLIQVNSSTLQVTMNAGSLELDSFTAGEANISSLTVTSLAVLQLQYVSTVVNTLEFVSSSKAYQLEVSTTADLQGSVKAGSLTVTGATIVTGTTDLQSSVKANSLTVTTNTIVSGTADLQSSVKAGSLTVTGTAIVTDATDLQSSVKAGSLTVTGAAIVTSTTDLQSSVKANSLTVTGGAIVTGETDLQNSVKAGNLLVTGTANVSGAAIFSNTVDLQSSVNANSLTVTGALIITDTTDLQSSVKAASLDVTGALSVAGGVTVTGGLNIDSITASGEIDAAAFATTSDRRLKKDVEEVADALSKVKALRPVEYNWISSANLNPSCKELGFLAQEVEEVVPAVVSTGDDENATKRVAYDRLTALLVGAVKEQSAIIDALKARIEALESKCA